MHPYARTGLSQVSDPYDKNLEEGGWEQRKICWGILYDTLKETVTLPEAKLLKAYHLLRDPALDPGHRVLSLELPM